MYVRWVLLQNGVRWLKEKNLGISIYMVGFLCSNHNVYFDMKNIECAC